MLIAFDVGNSTVDCGLFDGELLLATWRYELDRRRTAEAYRAMLSNSLSEQGLQPPKCGIAASVAVGVSDVLAASTESLWGVPLVIVNNAGEIGIDVHVSTPERVGIDRLLSAAEGYRITGGATVVADLGTAITVDLVSSEGIFLGGTITAGLRQTSKALAIGTSLLPEADIRRPESVLGKSTLECIRAGVVYGAAGAVDRLASELVKEAGGTAEVLLTGGDAQLLSPFLSVRHSVENALVLRGLNRVFQSGQ